MRPQVQRIVYRGVIYRRYAGRPYFEPSAKARRKGAQDLHRQIYVDTYGPIPPGWHVHHRDHDGGNNAPENLVALADADHKRIHTVERLATGDLSTILAAYRASPRGQANLRAAGRRLGEAAPIRTGTCQRCGVAFSRKCWRTVRYCSRTCSTRDFGVDVACRICQRVFRSRGTTKGQAETCSYRCGWALRKQRAAAAC